MDKFNQKLISLLKKDLRLVDEESGELIRNEVVNSAYKIDKELISLLLEDKEVKSKFFSEIKGHWIFEINLFVSYVQDKNFLSDSYTKFKNKIGLNIDGKFLNERKEVSLVWPFKDCVLEGGMTKEDEKRNEIFFNEILAQDEIDRLLDPKILTNFKKYNSKGEEKVKDFNRDKSGTINDNLIIKGNNLIALHSLKKEFAGKVKLIYIDPPYNTQGNTETFTYNNTFSHSTWLTFMKNRLEIAKELLREDGFIAIAIDHYELFYLGALADDIFRRENRIGVVSVVHKPEGRNQEKFFGTSNDFMLVYSKNKDLANFRGVILDEEKKESFNKNDSLGRYRLNNYIRLGGGDQNLRKNKTHFFYPVYVSKDLKKITLEKKEDYSEILPITNSGQERTWKTIKETLSKQIGDGEIVAQIDENKKVQIYEKYREEKGQVIKTHWIGTRYNAINNGTKLLEELLGKRIFSYPKPLYAVLDTIKIMADKEDIILDFFAGSGTTGHATLELNKEDGGNRKFILIEQLDAHAEVILKRLNKVIELDSKQGISHSNIVYCELMKHNEEAMEGIQDAKDTKQLLKIWNEMCGKYFLNYDVDIKKFDDNKSEFEKLSLTNQKKLLCEMLNKNQLYVNLSEMEDAEFKISKEDKELNKKFYN
ncbi:MAG: site-specific DNA-methyltransferase [Nanoarchaeota archaeon]